MANHKSGAQRYNDRMHKIFAEAEVLNAKYGNPDSLHGDNRSEAMKKSMSKKMKIKSEKRDSPYQKEDGRLVGGGESQRKSKHFGGTYSFKPELHKKK